MTPLRLIPEPPGQDPEWLARFILLIVKRRPRLGYDGAAKHACHAYSAMFLLEPGEAAELWDETMRARLPSWSLLG